MNRTDNARPRDAVVYVIDSDPSLRHDLKRMINAMGHGAEMFDSPGAFEGRRRASAPSCLLMDLQQHNGDGLALQRRLRESGDGLPIIFMAEHCSVAAAVDATKGGAVDLLSKPLCESTLESSIRSALRMDETRRESLRTRQSLLERLSLLSAREREVMRMVIEGHANRAIAERLSLSSKTVAQYRASLMKKIKVANVVGLVHFAAAVRSV